MSTQEPTKMLLNALANLQESSDYSDLTITCGSDVYKVHKAIACAQSEFFRLACRTRSDAKGDFKEGKTGIVEIPRSGSKVGDDDADWDMDAEDPKSVKLMIHYLYHMDYLEVETAKIKAQPFSNIVSNDHDLSDGILVDHARMYAMGDKYGIPGLKTLAVMKFDEATKHTFAGLVKAIRIAYTSTVDSDKGLRQIITTKLHSIGIANALGKPGIDQNIRDLSELAYALLRKQLGLA